MKAKMSLLFAGMLMGLYTMTAFAADAVGVASPSPAAVVAPAPVVAAPVVVAPVDFLAQVLQAAQNFGGLPTLLKIAAIITLLIASMKVSYLNTLIWSKLGNAQVYVAPVLGVIAGVLGLGMGGAPITLASVFAYATAGAGAVFIHEILDSVKAIPGLGPIYVAAINAIEKALGGPAAQDAKVS